MKKFRPTLIYLSAALLLSAYIYFFERGPVKKPETKTAKVFTNFVADDIREIKLEGIGTTLTADKSPIDLKKGKGDSWRIVEPRQFKVDETTLRSILNDVGELKPETTIDHPGNLADYGLNPPRERCTFIDKSGKPFVLLVGDRTPTGSEAYFKTADKDAVYLLGVYTADSLHKGVEDLRDHTFFQTDPVLAKKVRVVKDGKSIVLEKDKDNDWSIAEPLKAKADPSKVRELLNSVSTLRVNQFVADHPARLNIYGLDKPKAEVEVWPSDGGPVRAVLLGRKKLKSEGYFAKDLGEPSVSLVGGYFFNSLKVQPSDYFDRTLLQFDGGAVKALTVKHGGRTFAYQKDAKGKWSCPGRPNAQTEAAGLISQLAGITISDFVGKGADTGLKSPSFTVDVGLTDGTHRLFRFGKREKNEVYLAAGGSKEVYLVPAGAVSEMEVDFSSILTPVPVHTPAAKK